MLIVKATKKIKFYACLASLIHNKEFLMACAEITLRLYEEVREEVTPKVDLFFLVKVHDEFHSTEDLDLVEEITENCFKDLAAHMRNPKARGVFQTFTRLSGTYEKEDLFVHIANVRHLSQDANGSVVVTLVVNSHKGLKDLLENTYSGARCDFVEEVHSV